MFRSFIDHHQGDHMAPLMMLYER